jgi:hypothetical protein
MKTVYGAPALEQFASPAWRSLHGMAAWKRSRVSD